MAHCSKNDFYGNYYTDRSSGWTVSALGKKRNSGTSVLFPKLKNGVQTPTDFVLSTPRVVTTRLKQTSPGKTKFEVMEVEFMGSSGLYNFGNKMLVIVIYKYIYKNKYIYITPFSKRATHL